MEETHQENDKEHDLLEKEGSPTWRIKLKRSVSEQASALLRTHESSLIGQAEASYGTCRANRASNTTYHVLKTPALTPAQWTVK